jgi:hypothetical protein
MFTSMQRRSAAALCLALGLLVASTVIGGGPAHAASTHRYTNHKPLSDNYPGSHAAGATDAVTLRPGLQYPNPRYPNHKPLRGNYPGSYTASTPAQQPNSGFDWLAAGVGAAGMLGLILLLTAGKTAMRLAHSRRHDVPFVVQVRDDTSGVG